MVPLRAFRWFTAVGGVSEVVERRNAGTSSTAEHSVLSFRFVRLNTSQVLAVGEWGRGEEGSRWIYASWGRGRKNRLVFRRRRGAAVCLSACWFEVGASLPFSSSWWKT